MGPSSSPIGGSVGLAVPAKTDSSSLEVPKAPKVAKPGHETLSSFGSASTHRQSEQPQRPPVRLQTIRHALAHSSWYRSTVATELRAAVHGKPFALLMVLALLVALFMNDLAVIGGVNDNTPTDIILCIVMFLFTMELVLLSAVDASYTLSFFQLMDIIGTVSMIFDISFMLGQDATVPQQTSGQSDAKQNLTLLRAARAAKIGARAGRLSRVLRILRLLPCLSDGDNKMQRGIASTISGQLANLLAIRVACLTIILVMVVPLFDIWTFPQRDYSMTAWVGRLSKSHADGQDLDTQVELDLMVRFYSSSSYGPYKACAGVQPSGAVDFHCTDGGSLLWAPIASAPPRESSALQVHTGSFMVAFNMHSTAQLEAGLAVATMIFIIILMLFSGLTLSSVVTELTVRPLERMLGTVRTIASTVFKFTKLVEEEPTDEEEADINVESSNEIKLLEKVVHKLAIIADLQTGKNMPKAKADLKDLQDEDLGVLALMHGKNIVEEAARNDRELDNHGSKRRSMAMPSVRLEDFGTSVEVFVSWAFNPLPLSKSQRIALTVFTISQFHEASDNFFTTPEEVQLLQRFATAIEKEYLFVPFHSFAHAMDVVHCTSRLMRLTNSEKFLSELEQFSMLIAAVAHDVGHPGVNNGFLSEVGHELALQYNDESPLENMHCAKLYTIVAKPGANVFHKLTKEQYKEVRKCCIEVILHTDMVMHNPMLKDLQMLYQMNTEAFAEGTGASSVVAEVFSQPDNKILAMDTILHAADVSNPCKVWEVTHQWALACIDEFFAQGDEEKTLGIPVQFLNDREKLNRPNSQIGFIEFMIAPFFTTLVQLWPGTSELGENLISNLATWADIWEKEVAPSEEDTKKMAARVDKVRENMINAIAVHAS